MKSVPVVSAAVTFLLLAGCAAQPETEKTELPPQKTVMVPTQRQMREGMEAKPLEPMPGQPGYGQTAPPARTPGGVEFGDHVKQPGDN